MKLFAFLFSLFVALVVAQETSQKTTRTVTSTLTSTYVSTCTVLFATTDAPKPSAVNHYPLTNGTVATTTPVPSASITNPSGTGSIKPASTNTPYSAASSSGPQALFALVAGIVVLVAST